MYTIIFKEPVDLELFTEEMLENISSINEEDGSVISYDVSEIPEEGIYFKDNIKEYLYALAE